jgi:hypothetical protein
MIGAFPSKYLAQLLAVALATSVAAGLVQTVRVERLKHDVARVVAERDGFKHALKTSEQNRATEKANALASVNDLTAFCRTERAAAVKAGRRISEIVNAPAPPAGTPRRVVSSRELRDVIGQAAPAEAGGVPARPSR